MKKEGFSVGMALMDALPVLFFGIAMTTLGLRLDSSLFLAGALVCILAGLGKVIWKLVIALGGRDIALLGAQLRYVMPVGFLLMVIGGVQADREVVGEILQRAVCFPSLAFFLLGVLGIAGMVACARHFDRRDVKGNWIEQSINALAQGFVLAGVMFL